MLSTVFPYIYVGVDVFPYTVISSKTDWILLQFLCELLSTNFVMVSTEVWNQKLVNNPNISYKYITAIQIKDEETTMYWKH